MLPIRSTAPTMVRGPSATASVTCTWRSPAAIAGRRQNGDGRHHHRPREAAGAVQAANPGDGRVDLRLHERLACFQPNDGHSSAVGIDVLPSIAIDVHEVARPPRYREADRQLAGRLFARIRRHRHRGSRGRGSSPRWRGSSPRAGPRPPMLRRESGTRRSRSASGSGSPENATDTCGPRSIMTCTRAPMRAGCPDGAAEPPGRRCGLPELRRSPGAQRRLIFLQLRIDVCRVVRAARRRCPYRRAPRGPRDRPSSTVNLADDGTGPRIDVDHHRCAIRLMGDLDARRDGRLHVAALAVDGLQRTGDFLCARRDRRVAKALRPQRGAACLRAMPSVPRNSSRSTMWTGSSR